MRPVYLGTLALLLMPLAATAAERATADFIDRSGNPVGQATLTDGPQGLLLEVDITGLAPGPHGIHFHSVGTCEDAADGFKASKGHVKTGEAEHGLLNPKGAEAGDLVNLYADADGKAKAQIFNGMVALSDKEGRANLLDQDGTAVVVHAQEDDHVTQPIGGAGDRIACAVVEAAG